MADQALEQGFALMGYGLAFVFMALIVLYVFIKVMTFVFREKKTRVSYRCFSAVLGNCSQQPDGSNEQTADSKTGCLPFIFLPLG